MEPSMTKGIIYWGMAFGMDGGKHRRSRRKLPAYWPSKWRGWAKYYLVIINWGTKCNAFVPTWPNDTLISGLEVEIHSHKWDIWMGMNELRGKQFDEFETRRKKGKLNSMQNWHSFRLLKCRK
jgi:hypothetical protein